MFNKFYTVLREYIISKTPIEPEIKGRINILNDVDPELCPETIETVLEKLNQLTQIVQENKEQIEELKRTRFHSGTLIPQPVLGLSWSMNSAFDNSWSWPLQIVLDLIEENKSPINILLTVSSNKFLKGSAFYTSQNRGSDGNFEMLNGFVPLLVQKLYHKRHFFLFPVICDFVKKNLENIAIDFFLNSSWMSMEKKDL